MLQKNGRGICLGFALGCLSMAGMEPMRRELGSFLIEQRSFHSLVRTKQLDDKQFSDIEGLKTKFRDINVRKDGMTPLQVLVTRPDAKVDHVQALLACGANPDIPALVKVKGGNQWYQQNTYSRGLAFILSPAQEQYYQYYGNKDVMNYLFDVMLEQKVQQAIQQAWRENRISECDNEVIILPQLNHQHDWVEIDSKQARNLLKESIKDQRELEVFLRNLSSEVLVEFLQMHNTMQ